MPQWTGIVETASPIFLEECRGDPVAVRETIMARSPAGANVSSVFWETERDLARLTIEGPAARDYLMSLEARDVFEVVTDRERQDQKR